MKVIGVQVKRMIIMAVVMDVVMESIMKTKRGRRERRRVV
jgi:hypothetical protein